MYLDYFKLKDFPFSLVSDPRFLYLTKNHSKVKAFLEYAMNIQDSFVVITGEIGTGKTTLINNALENAGPNNIVINIQATKLNNTEFLQMLLLEIGLQPYQFNKIQMLDELRRYLIQRQNSGKKVFLIIDEAQNLEKAVLEDIRYLSDLEGRQQKLLNVIIVGQPALNKTLDESDMEHFLQRIRLRTHIKALASKDVKPYIQHRLQVAGAESINLFAEDAYKDVYQFTAGRLRLINTLCDYALMVCYVDKLEQVNSWAVQIAANELQWETYDKRFGRYQDATKLPANLEKQVDKAKLVVKQAGQLIGEFPLDKGALTIGRQVNNDIQLNSHKVSRKHAQVLAQDNNFYLHDLSSTNGTLVNGDKITVHALQHGEVFNISDYQFAFYVPASVVEMGTEMPELYEQRTDCTRIFMKKNDTRRFGKLSIVSD